MSLSSYSDVFEISHERGYEEHITVGDLVRTSANLHPHFQVIAISGDKAWVRNVQSGQDSLAQLDRCRRIEAVVLSLAAE